MKRQRAVLTSAVKRENVLHPKVAELYEIPHGRSTRFVCAEFGDVDLGAVDLKFAERLAEKGYLKKKSAAL